MPFPVDPKFIQRAADRIGVRLPASYVARLTRVNGGEVFVGEDVWHLYPVLDDSDRTRLKRSANHVVLETKSAREWPDFPPDAIAIAQNGTGDQLILLPDSALDRLGNAVYCWLHESGSVERVADDLADL